MRIGGLSLGAVSLFGSIALLGCGGLCAADEVELTYEINFSPETTVLSLRHSGGLGRYGYHYSLHGDGRLVAEEINRGTGEATRTRERQLEQADLEALTELAIGAGLVECDESRLRELIGQESPQVSDGLTLYLEITLESYEGPRRAEPAPFTHTLSVHSPRSLSILFPKVREVEGLLALHEALRAHSKLEAFDAPVSD